ncbi:hypothetical protein PI125_g14895 [Phytophthora idaei]|nr:hypothetical protein PI125_g14895 [Phytophthora idaei]KAG3139474.1 hypothetical protein PI126_g16445 [Phytophthora idaei]
MADAEGHVATEWTQIWRTEDSRRGRDTYLREGLPRFATVRSEIRNCTIDHLENEDIDLALSRHSMRTVMTACRSESCIVEHDDDACMCCYTILSAQTMPPQTGINEEDATRRSACHRCLSRRAIESQQQSRKRRR